MKLQRWFMSEDLHGSLGILTSFGNGSSGVFRYLDCYLAKNLRHAVRMNENDQGEVSYYFVENGKEIELTTSTKIKTVKKILAEKSQVVEYNIHQVRYNHPGKILCARFMYEGPNQQRLTITKMVFETTLEAQEFTPRFSLGESISPEEWSNFQIWKIMTGN